MIVNRGPMNIVIVGIAGLSLAIGLKQRGLTARVYETAPEVKELGVGITLLPHATREFAALGLLERLKAVAIENEVSFFSTVRASTSTRSRAASTPGYPFPELGIHRGKLHRIQFEAAREQLGAENK